MNTIKQTMNSFLNVLREKDEGGPFSRFKSWEYCHEEFLKAHKNKKNRDIDYLALHLSFYLASWGMYRGSSFILQRDYKTHRPIVEMVLKSEYDDLWDFDPKGKAEEELKRISELAVNAYADVESAYGEKIPERYFTDDDGDSDKPVSTTLITKILMGTFGISPAFDRFFKDGIKLYLFNRKPNQTIVRSSNHYDSKEDFAETIKALFKFADSNSKQLDFKLKNTRIGYPNMKKVDMYFWEIGYEYSFYVSLEKKKGKLNLNDQFDDIKTKKSYLKTVEQVKTLFRNEIQLSNENNYRATIDEIMLFLKKRLGKMKKSEQ